MNKLLVYFARASTGEIKIGISANPESRIKTLNTGSPCPIALLKTIQGSYDLERALHLRFADERRQGEWFDPSERLLKYIADLPGRTHFDFLCVLEPRLKDIMVDAQLVRDRKTRPYFCANEVFYGAGKLKDRLCELVGWHAASEDPELRSSSAYDTAYEAVYGALPNCRECRCLGV